MPPNRLYTQLQELPVVEAADITANEDGLFCNVNGVDSYVPFDELGTVVGVDATIPARVTALEAEDVSLDSRIDALEGASSGVFITPQDYGAIGDGLSHPLSSVYANLAAAQVDYPFATALTQEIDYCAFKKMCLTSLGQEGAEHADTNAHLNLPMFIPAGNYMFGNDTLLIRNSSGVKMWGAGRRSTRIYSNVTVLAFDGLWYSEFADFTLQCLTNTATVALDIDGNVPGHPYATRGVQANTFRNILVDGGLGSYAVAITRLGGSGGQGSENIFINCHFQRATLACYFQNGYNALNNTIFGGNFQTYSKHGIYLVAGQVSVISVGFQSTYGYDQIINDGFDIDCNSAGVSDEILVVGCRTESLRFYRGAGSQPANLQSINGTPSIPNPWPGAGQVIPLNYVFYTHGAYATRRMYRATTAGTTGGVEPVWPLSGTVADGTVVWTTEIFKWIDIQEGNVDRKTCRTAVGFIANNDHSTQAETTVDYIVEPMKETVLVDTTAGPVQIGLPADTDDRFPRDHSITIIKSDTSANGVTVYMVDGGAVNFVVGSANLAGGTRGYVTLRRLGGDVITRRWYITSKGTV